MFTLAIASAANCCVATCRQAAIAATRWLLVYGGWHYAVVAWPLANCRQTEYSRMPLLVIATY